MSQETNRTEDGQNQEQPLDYAPPVPSNKRNLTPIFIVIILLLVFSNIYFAVQLNKVKNDRATVLSQYNASDSSRQAIENDYNAALVRLDELMSQNSVLDSALHDKNSEVAILRRQIDKIIKNKNATAAELGKAKRLIGQLNSKVQTYEERIAMLESDNMRLEKMTEILEEERSELAAEREELYKLGSVLHASNIRMMPIDIRKGGKKVKETEKAKRVDVMRIKFDIDENRIAQNSVQEIYLVITDPNGSLLSNAAYGSGVTILDGGEEINYTISKLISLEKNKPINDVTVDWQQDSEYKEGTYAISIYQGGFKIGSGNVELR